MRDQKRDKERLAHILAAIGIIENGISMYPKSELLDNPLLYYGLVKQVEIIGEAANMLTQEFRDCHTEVNWRPIVNMRHVLVHDYVHISKDMLWATITQDIPQLKVQIEHYYKHCE